MFSFSTFRLLRRQGDGRTLNFKTQRTLKNRPKCDSSTVTSSPCKQLTHSATAVAPRTNICGMVREFPRKTENFKYQPGRLGSILVCRFCQLNQTSANGGGGQSKGQFSVLSNKI